MNKKQCRDALDLYKKFLIRMDRVGEFLKVAEVSYTHGSNVKTAVAAVNAKLTAYFLCRMSASIRETYQI